MSSDAGRRSVSKGKNGEREFIRCIARLTGGKVNLQRNLSQCRDRGDDCSTDRFSIEIKRHKTATDSQVNQWWHQCQANAAQQDKVPVLAFRADQQTWQVLLHPNLFFPEPDGRGCIRMGIELFCQCLLDPGAFHMGWFERFDHAPPTGCD